MALSDTELTYIYKKAWELNMPAKFFLLRKRLEGEEELPGTDFTVIEPISEVIQGLIEAETSLPEINRQVQTMTTLPVEKEDVIAIYLESKYPPLKEAVETQNFKILDPEILELLTREVNVFDGKRSRDRLIADYVKGLPKIKALKAGVKTLVEEGLDLFAIYDILRKRLKPVPPKIDVALAYLEVRSNIEEAVRKKNLTLLDEETFERLRQEINAFDGLRTRNRLIRDYELRSKEFKKKMGEDAQIAEKIQELHAEILSEAPTPYPRSPLYKKSEKVLYKGYTTSEVEQGEEPEPQFKTVAVDMEDGFDLFNETILSEEVPFVQYNAVEKIGDLRGRMKSYYKVFRGKTVDKEPNYKNIMIPPEEITEPNTLYLKMWFHHPNEKKSRKQMHLAPASAFITVVFDLAANILSFEIPHMKDLEDSFERYMESLPEDVEIPDYGVDSVSEWVIIHALYTALPTLTLTDREEEGIKADIFIYGPEVDATTFAYAISMNAILRNYLYIEESTHPQALKNQLSVRYTPYPINEPAIPAKLKKSKFVSKRGLSATIKQVDVVLGALHDVYNVETGVIDRISFESFTPTISLSISRTANVKAIEEFLNTFTYLLRIYTNETPSIIEFYRDFLTRKEQAILFEGEEVSVISERVEGEDILIDLKAVMPDLTKHGFSRASQGLHKPKAIRKEDIPEWVQQTFKYHNKDYHKQVLPFPKPPPSEAGTILLVTYRRGKVHYLIQDSEGSTSYIPMEDADARLIDPEGWIACPTTKNPFLGVKENTSMETKDRYPYIPRCYNSQTTEPYKKGAVTGYQKYYLGVREEKARAKTDNILRTDKILVPGGKGELAPEIEEILNQYPKKSSHGQFLRYGVPQTPNSLLHSVLLALEDPKYLKQPSDALKEAYVRRVRRYMTKQVHPALLKQELYDRPLDEIFDMLCNEDQFLDPSIFYRALEVVFDINIFTYGYRSASESNAISGSSEGQMIIPRHKVFHTQPYRSLPTILILRNWGGATDTLNYPQSELIIEDIRGAHPVMLFDVEMGKINYNVLQQTATTIVWKFTRDGRFEAHTNIYSEEEDRYSQPNYEKLIDHQGQVQVLDNYGKMRGLIFLGASEDDDTQEVTMLFSPSQPVNLPLTREARTLGCEEKEQVVTLTTPTLTRCNVETAVSIFGSPGSMTKDYEDHVTGLWFGQKDTEKVYVPIERTSRYSELPLGNPNPFETSIDESVQKLEKMKRDLDFIQQILWWLYLIAREEKGPTYRFETFVRHYFAYDTFKGDSAYYYNLIGLRRTFPQVESIEQGIQALERQEREGLGTDVEEAHFLLDDNRVWFYNKSFHDKITAWLRKKIKLEIGVGDPPQKPNVFQRYFVKASDFQSQKFVSVFLGKRELKKWLESLSASDQIHKIHTKITPTLTLSTEPFIFQDVTDGKIYLIQNVLGGSKSRAMNVGYMWLIEKRNLGSQASPGDEQYPHMIYGESISGLKLLEDQRVPTWSPIRYQNIPVVLGRGRGKRRKGKEREEEEEYLRLLQYNLTGIPHYAAMLELL